MKWEVDKIISGGLVVMGILSIIGWIWYSISTGNSNGTEIPMAIVSGLTGALAGKNIQNSSRDKEDKTEKGDIKFCKYMEVNKNANI